MGTLRKTWHLRDEDILYVEENHDGKYGACLLYTSPSPRDS